MRKSLEADISMLRAERGVGATQAMVDEAVARAMREQGAAGGGAGGGAGAAALEEKVKECGRMILRMGSELMEETKLRLQLVRRVPACRMPAERACRCPRARAAWIPLSPFSPRLSLPPSLSPFPLLPFARPPHALGSSPPQQPSHPAALSDLPTPSQEAEMQEMRMRLGGLEASARSGAPYVATAPPVGVAATPHPDPYGAAAAAFNPAAAAAAGFAAASCDATYCGSAPPPPPFYRGDSASAPPSPPGAAAARAHGIGAPSAAASGGSGAATLAASASYAALLGQGTASAASAAAEAPAAGRRPAREGGALSGSAAALRLSREELDARVQQILGRAAAVTVATPPGDGGGK